MKAHDVIFAIYFAMRETPATNINDVTLEEGADGQVQLIVTTDDGTDKQTWVLDEQSVLETDVID